MNSGIVLEFNADAVVVLLVLGAILVLPLEKGATVEVVLPTCHKYSSKLCLLFDPFGPTSAKDSCVRITTLGQPPASRV